MLGEKTFVFLDNYIKLFQDSQFWNSLLFTMKYAVFVTPCLFILAFILALMINGAFKGVNLFRSLYFAPVVISMTCCSMVWLWIYNDLYGVLNYLLQTLGIVQDPVLWMNSATDVSVLLYNKDQYQEAAGTHELEPKNTYYEDGIEAVQKSWRHLRGEIPNKNLGFSWHYLKPILELLDSDTR